MIFLSGHCCLWCCIPLIFSLEWPKYSLRDSYLNCFKVEKIIIYFVSYKHLVTDEILYHGLHQAWSLHLETSLLIMELSFVQTAFCIDIGPSCCVLIYKRPWKCHAQKHYFCGIFNRLCYANYRKFFTRTSPDLLTAFFLYRKRWFISLEKVYLKNTKYF